MQISAINKQSGFSLLEVLIVITILGITFSLVTLSLPKSVEKEWQRDLETLTSNLNQAREEAATSGVPIRWVVSPQGWSFKQRNTAGDEVDLKRPLEPKSWSKQPVESQEKSILIGKEVFTPPLVLEFTRNNLKARIQRNETGRFQLISK